MTFALAWMGCSEPSAYPVITAAKSEKQGNSGVTKDWYKRYFSRFPRAAWVSRAAKPVTLVEDAAAPFTRELDDFIVAPVIESKRAQQKIRVVFQTRELRFAAWVHWSAVRTALRDRTYFANGVLMGLPGLRHDGEGNFVDQGVRIKMRSSHAVDFVFNGPPRADDADYDSVHYYHNDSFSADLAGKIPLGTLRGQLSATLLERVGQRHLFHKKTGFLRGRFWTKASNGPPHHGWGRGGGGYGRGYQDPTEVLEAGDCLRIDGVIVAVALEQQKCLRAETHLTCYLYWDVTRRFDRVITRRCVPQAQVEAMKEDHGSFPDYR